MAYQIIDWNRFYENAKSRSIDNCSWSPIPTKQDGLSYRRIAKEFPQYYAVFVGLVLACMKQRKEDRAGWLTDDGTAEGIAWTASDISAKIGINEDVIEGALPYLCSDRIKWLREVKERKPLGEGDEE